MNDAIRSQSGLMERPWSVYIAPCLIAMVFGVRSLHSLMTIYRLEPAGEGQK
jgi:hypothetical protein